MTPGSYHNDLLELPFFDAAHRSLADEARVWAADALNDGAHEETPAAIDARCRRSGGAPRRGGLDALLRAAASSAVRCRISMPARFA